MKIIEALKLIKDLKRKLDDIKDKIKTYCADLDCETPVYADQRRQVDEWLQSHYDIVKEIGKLKYGIRKTNLATKVTIELGGIYVTKSICEWIDRRKELAMLNEQAYRALTDKNIREFQQVQVTQSSPVQTVKRRLYFDPKERDTKIELYRSEPAKINAVLEITNAVTELIDA